MTEGLLGCVEDSDGLDNVSGKLDTRKTMVERHAEAERLSTLESKAELCALPGRRAKRRTCRPTSRQSSGVLCDAGLGLLPRRQTGEWAGRAGGGPSSGPSGCLARFRGDGRVRSAVAHPTFPRRLGTARVLRGTESVAGSP